MSLLTLSMQSLSVPVLFVQSCRIQLAPPAVSIKQRKEKKKSSLSRKWLQQTTRVRLQFTSISSISPGGNTWCSLSPCTALVICILQRFLALFLLCRTLFFPCFCWWDSSLVFLSANPQSLPSCIALVFYDTLDNLTAFTISKLKCEINMASFLTVKGRHLSLFNITL